MTPTRSPESRAPSLQQGEDGLGWGPKWLPAAVVGLVLLVLVALLVVPAVSQRQSAEVRSGIRGVLEPARVQATDLAGAIPHEIAALRGYVLSGDPRFLERFREGRASQEAALEALRQYAPQIGPGLEPRLRVIDSTSQRWQARVDSLVSGSLPRSEFVRRLPEQQALYETALAEAIAIDSQIAHQIEQARSAIVAIERTEMRRTLSLIGLAVLTVLLVGWLVWRQQRAERAYRRTQRSFRALADSIPQLAWMADREGSIFWYNERWYDYTGTAFEEMGGWGWQAVHHPEHVDRVLRSFRHAVATGEPWEDTFPLRSRQGEYRWFLSRAQPIPDDSGAIIRWFGTNTDITELREAQAASERRAREEQALREAAAAVSASHTTDEIVQKVAASALVAMGADGAFVEQVDLGSGITVVTSAVGTGVPNVGTRMPYTGSYAERVIEQAIPQRIDNLGGANTPLQERFDRLCPGCTAVVIPLINPGGAIGALVLVRGAEQGRFHDDEVGRAETFANLAALAFRRVQLLDESQKRRRELEDVTESRARLMRGFSHDLKNPLGAADGHLALLESGALPDPEKRNDSVRRSRSLIATALRLIDDLVDLARAEAGNMEIEYAPVDVGLLALEVGEQYRAQAEAKGLGFEIVPPDQVELVESDHTRIRQILGNLLSNAVKYTDRGEVSLKVGGRVAGEGGGRWIIVEVQDTGPGIPDAKKEELFREFTRLHDGDVPGAGIGLAIAQRVAHALGGRITVESDEGVGSTFLLWLPTAAQRAAVGSEGSSDREPGPGRSHAEEVQAPDGGTSGSR